MQVPGGEKFESSSRLSGRTKPRVQRCPEFEQGLGGLGEALGK